MTLFSTRPVFGLLSLAPLSLAPLSLALLVGGQTAARSQEFASSVASFSNLSTNSLYSNPNAALGQPTTIANDGFGDISHDSLALPAYGSDPQGNNLLVSLGSTGTGSLTVKFDEAPITHSDSHWYGEDFLVYSNDFFRGQGSNYVNPTTDMSQYLLNADPSKILYGTLPTVSVSSDGINFVTLAPADSVFFPENPYQWAGISAQNPTGWDDSSLQDFSKPVDPSLTLSAFTDQTAAYAANTLYNGSAGGTAFSLAGTQFADTGIQYVRFTGAGNIDGISRVGDAPAAVPEASSAVSLGVLGLLGLGVMAPRRRKTA